MFLPRVLRSFRHNFPLVDVDLLEMVPRHQLEALLDDRVDLAFVARPEVEFANQFAFEPLMEVELRIALPLDHPLAKLKRIPLARLEEEPFVILKRSAAPATHEFFRRLCRSAGFEPKIVKQSDRAQSILDLVAAGVGVSIVPEFFQRYQNACVMRSLVPGPPAVPLCLVWRQNDTSAPLRALRAIILQHFRDRSPNRGVQEALG
jgi:DNA-binding transcriptional LysR family regulator